MSQYKTGTVSVTKDSQVVTGSGTSWLSNVQAGDGFTISGSGITYTVASVDSDTQITLSANYAGADQSGAAYAVFRDFTTNHNIPEMQQGDIETATIFTRAMRTIDSAILKLDNLALQGTVGVYGSTSNGIAATTSGDYFFVVDASNLVLYLNDAGTGTLQGTYPLLEDIQTEFDTKLAQLESNQAAFQADHVRLSRSLSKDPDKGETLRADFATNAYGLASDFTGLDSAIAFNDMFALTRASTKTVTGPDGYLNEVAVDEPAFEYDPITGEPLGLLIEEQRTNLLLWSENLTKTEWAKSSSLSITASADQSPINSATAYDVEDDGTLSQSFFYQSAACTPGESYSFKVVLKPDLVSAPTIAFYDETNAAFITIDAQKTSRILPSGFVIYEAVVTAPSGCNSLRVYPDRSVAVTGRRFIYAGSQLEAGSFSTSYIQTTSAQVTRSADGCSRTLGAELNQPQGTVYFEGRVGYSYGYAFALGSVRVRRNGTSLVALGLANTIGLGNVPLAETFKLAFSWDGSDTILAVNGASNTKSNPGISAGTALRLGSYQNVQYSDGEIKNFRILPHQSTATELEALTV